jgi:hypothetical protein
LYARKGLERSLVYDIAFDGNGRILIQGYAGALRLLDSGLFLPILIGLSVGSRGQSQGYGAESKTVVPAYSTLQFFVWLQSWRRSGIPGDM